MNEREREEEIIVKNTTKNATEEFEEEEEKEKVKQSGFVVDYSGDNFKPKVKRVKISREGLLTIQFT